MRCACAYGCSRGGMEGNLKGNGATHRRARARIYNAAMDKLTASRRHVRRTAWWVAFAALAGFLLADLT